ncbi:DgyrCDS1867 [Dimorphilus gyrociliatus]|uniref:Cation-transporting ATPase n=1 Tax=Dimorphilus gyrociliatus TaxID=2664684 RepID=A0A7I8V8M3_9ANNE|nr:DgyrCDS1867 [Dimorphilus gyrociliatus]
MAIVQGEVQYSIIDQGGVPESYINDDIDDEMKLEGFKSSTSRSILYWICICLSLGILYLIFYWKPNLKVKLKMARCCLTSAEVVIITNNYRTSFVEKVQFQFIDYGVKNFSSNTEPKDQILRYFDHKHTRYYWDEESNYFTELKGLDEGYTCAYIHDNCNGLSDDHRRDKLRVFGENRIKIDVKSYFKLFIEEVLNPFYIFQIFSISLWMADEYYYYASCICLMSLISIGISLYETRKQSETLRDMVGSSEGFFIEILNDEGHKATVDVTTLVPGDVIILPRKGLVMTCDAVLLTGNAIVNESMLTGESVPVTKTSLTPSEGNEQYSPENHKLHTLFAGFSTAKGELICSILFPKPVGFKFYQDSMKFIGALGCLAVIGMAYSIWNLIYLKVKYGKVVIRALDIVTIVVPPGLPAAMTIGTIYSQSRLKKQNIFCISPARINICGKLKLICFDKTGTLTEDGLDLFGVLPLQGKCLALSVMQPTDLPSLGPFVIAMATCHSLTIIDGKLTGDPLDLNMFNSTNWVLEEAGADSSKFETLAPTVVRPTSRDVYYEAQAKLPFEVGIIKQFAFSSSLQRMSVVTRTLRASHMDLYCKGAPEKIASLCDPATVPEDFQARLQQYTKKGFRVLAIAWKALDKKVTWHHVQKMSREKLEYGMKFLGLLIMENRLKPQTTPVITKLNKADIKTVMVTGDNILTALSVARQCGIAPGKRPVIIVNGQLNPPNLTYKFHENVSNEESEDGSSIFESDMEPFYHLEEAKCSDRKYLFALSGKTYAILRENYSELLSRIITRGAVFARMSPEQKSQLVENFQSLGYTVGFCGDGANDCSALKMANAGISLSDAEASVAAPFTSKTPNIECVPTVIREGRAALVTSFGTFKYMALYSIVQFVSVIILYSFSTNMGDFQFLYIDLLITTVVAILMGHTGAYRALVQKRPLGSLFSSVNLLSVFLHIILVIAFQVTVLLFLQAQPWYVRVKPSPSANVTTCSETSLIFLTTSFQYLILAFIFSKGRPYRLPIWTNLPFTIALILLTSLSTFLLIYPPKFLAKFLQITNLPGMTFKLTLMGIIGIYFLMALFVEEFLITSCCIKRFLKCGRKHGKKNIYKTIELDLKMDTNWPPLEID